MPEVIGAERVFPQPTVTYVTASRPGCRKVLEQIHLMTMRSAEPGVVLDEIRQLIEDWRAGA